MTYVNGRYTVVMMMIIISPPESDSLRSGLKFYPWCFFSTREISEMRGPTGAKFCTMVSNRPYFIMPVQNFGARTPKKFQGPKTCKIWPDFGRLRSSATNISETDEDFQNRIVIPSIAITPALVNSEFWFAGWQVFSNFGQNFYWLYWVTEWLIDQLCLTWGIEVCFD